MRTEKKVRNFIIYFLLFTLVATGSKARLDTMWQVLSLCGHGGTKIVSEALITPEEDCLPDQITRQRATISSQGFLSCSRTGLSIRCGFLFILFILMVLSEISKLNWGVLALYSERYVYEKRYIITFIQDIDGRKRDSYC